MLLPTPILSLAPTLGPDRLPTLPTYPNRLLATYPYIPIYLLYYYLPLHTDIPTYPTPIYLVYYLVEYVVLGYGTSPIAANRWLAIDYFCYFVCGRPYFSFMGLPTPIYYYYTK